MKKVSLDTWIQLVGMLGIMGSLVFVGLEMRQTQRIALASQVQEVKTLAGVLSKQQLAAYFGMCENTLNEICKAVK